MEKAGRNEHISSLYGGEDLFIVNIFCGMLLLLTTSNIFLMEQIGNS